MVRIQFLEDEFEIDLEGIEKFEAVKRELRIPYSCISRVDDTAGDVYGGLRLMGTRLTQNMYDFGRFTTKEGEGFFAFRKRENAFAIHLINNKYGIIIIETENREQAIEELRAKMVKGSGA